MGVMRTMMEDMGSDPMMMPGMPFMTLGKYHSTDSQALTSVSY